MLEMLLGFGLGALAFTEAGRQIGNKIAEMAVDVTQKVMRNAKEDEPTKQSSGTDGDNRPAG